MDDETRFWIAKEVSNRKEGYDATGLFRQAKERAQTKTKVMITDGLRSYDQSFRKEFWTQKNPRPVPHQTHSPQRRYEQQQDGKIQRGV